METRKAAYAGSFYSDNADELSTQISSFLHAANIPDQNAKIVAVVSPHAGYVYSGPIAAYSYAAAQKTQYDCVIVLAPSHRARFDGFSVMPGGYYETPLGKVAVDETVGRALLHSPHASFYRDLDFLEHSLEVQIPFLQMTQENFSLVPIIIGQTDLALCREMASEIYACIKNDPRSFLIVISTDLSHYHSYASAQKRDGRFAEVLELFDEGALFALLQEEDSEACGEGPLITGITLARLMGAKKSRVLHYANSGDTAGDRSKVVGYISAVFTE